MQAGTHATQAPAVVPFGVPAIDEHLPSGGLLRGVLHEAACTGPETEHVAAAALFVAGILARIDGTLLWVMERSDLFGAALCSVGLSPTRVVFAEVGRDVLAAMEDGLRERRLAGVVGETSIRVTLTDSRRLQLAAESSGVPAFLLRRSRVFDDPRLSEPNAAVTRWRVAALPSSPPVPEAPDVPGFALARWRLSLIRCRGGEPATWIVEACDAQGHLRLVTDLRDRSAGTEWDDSLRRRAGGHLRA